MSINSALQAGVSGLVANSSALAAISDNIANVNTTAYKTNQVDFSTMVTSQAVSGQYSAGGVGSKNQQFVSQQGLIQGASSPTDLAISGDGFFVVSTSATNQASAFTRAGTFQPDSKGFHWSTTPGSTCRAGPSSRTARSTTSIPPDLSKVGPINVKNLGAAVEQTTNVAISANLNQSMPFVAPTTPYNKATNSMAAFAATGTGTPPDAPPIDLNVIDSMGGSHKLAVSFSKTANPNEWNAEIYAVPASDVTTGPAGPDRRRPGGVQHRARLDRLADLEALFRRRAKATPAGRRFGLGGHPRHFRASRRHRP